MNQIQSIVNYVCCAISVILSAFCLFKVLNSSRKINSVSDFINGEVFSVKFQAMLSNYFSEPKNTKSVLEPIIPWIRQNLENDKQIKIAETVGVLFVD
jgi:hypothetical protein